ncbi:MAG: ERCC4 domain-containing protein [Halodesulfurarchaeum sp.]
MSTGGTLTIDDREEDEEMIRNAERVADEMGVEVEEARIDAGDYVYESGRTGRRTAIEYKGVNDLPGSVVGDSPRLVKQANRLAEEFDWAAIWISGKVDELHTTHTEMTYGQMYEQIKEVMAEVQSTMNIITNWVHTTSIVADVGIRSMIRAGDQPPEEATRLLLSPGVDEDARMSMVLGLDNFGRTDAKRILETFGTLQHAMNAPLPSLLAVDGMGRGKARRFYNTARVPWDGEPGVDVDTWENHVWEFLDTHGVGDHILIDVLEGTNELQGDVREYVENAYPDMRESKRETIIEAANDAIS